MHTISRAEKHSSSKFATISSILTNIYRYFGLARDISTFKRTFYTILDAECSAHYIQGREAQQLEIRNHFLDMEENLSLFRSRWRYFVV